MSWFTEGEGERRVTLDWNQDSHMACLVYYRHSYAYPQEDEESSDDEDDEDEVNEDDEPADWEIDEVRVLIERVLVWIVPAFLLTADRRIQYDAAF